MDILTLVSGIALPISGVALTLAGRWIIAGQKDIRERLDTTHGALEKRVGSLETEARHFMPKSDLEKEFNHEKAGRLAADNAAAILIDRLRGDVTDMGKEIARLEQNDTYLTNEMNKLASTVDRGFNRVDDKLDKLADSLAKLDKRVA